MIIGIFSHFFAVETTLAERQFFRALAKLIGRRAARLSACGIAAIVSKMGYLDEGCSVGADGSLYNVSVPRFSCLNPLLDEIFLVRNIPDLRIGYMKAWSTFSAREEGWLFPMKVREFVLTNEHCRNITTYHAEDGSGVGSAIIAGLLLYLSWVLHDLLMFFAIQR
jgi:hexokinase